MWGCVCVKERERQRERLGSPQIINVDECLLSAWEPCNCHLALNREGDTLSLYNNTENSQEKWERGRKKSIKQEKQQTTLGNADHTLTETSPKWKRLLQVRQCVKSHVRSVMWVCTSLFLCIWRRRAWHDQSFSSDHSHCVTSAWLAGNTGSVSFSAMITIRGWFKRQTPH